MTERDYEAEIAELKSANAELRSTIASWFDLAQKAEDAITPVLIDGFKGWLRTAKNGGVEPQVADAAGVVLDEYCRQYAGRALLPILRGLAAADTEALSKDVDPPPDLVQRCKEVLEWRATGRLHGGSGGALRALKERLSQQGISEYDALSVAENHTTKEAMAEVVRLASSPPPPKPAEDVPEAGSPKL